MGSAPDVEGAPPLRRIQRARASGAYPPTGPPTARLTRPAPRVSSHMRHGPDRASPRIHRHGRCSDPPTRGLDSHADLAARRDHPGPTARRDH